MCSLIVFIDKLITYLFTNNVSLLFPYLVDLCDYGRRKYCSLGEGGKGIRELVSFLTVPTVREGGG